MFNNTRNPFANLTPVVKNLLIINIICFIPFVVFPVHLQDQIYEYCAAHYFGSPSFRIWQPITYMFLHGGFAHIFFNMFALYSFGGILEYALGSKRFFNLYFICGLGALALQFIVQIVEVYYITGHFTVAGVTAANVGVRDATSPFLAYDIPNAVKLYGVYNGTIVGASGAIFGLLVAFGMLYPNLELMIMFIPIPVKAKYIIPVYILVELFLGVKQFAGDDVAHFAHLGGALIGFIVIKLWGYGRRNNFY
ncbi:rhomboid-like protein [Mucilaginibacter yixingensis]|uniref:Rhomboid-like protein n=1 Tax=Mucilaginibacter yixingensis TaxID=1295612 RepID=A0A2T5J8U1_9SPHI|nr:rhomboid family intramembrane serine protease [Mucilaginibacter yixingensis]PTQ95883.1 rhomboid-like protein [Mucilaginibacter yixingensis]